MDPYLIYPRQRPPVVAENATTEIPKPYERKTLHPVRDREEFLRRLKIQHRQPKAVEAEYQNNCGCVIAFGFERHWNEQQPKLRAAEIEAERQRREREDQRIVWCE